RDCRCGLPQLLEPIVHVHTEGPRLGRLLRAKPIPRAHRVSRKIVPLPRTLREEAEDELLYVGHHVRRQREIRNRLGSATVEYLLHRAGERLAPRKQVIEDAPECIEIGRWPVVRRRTTDLFGGHPTWSPGPGANYTGRAFGSGEAMVDRIAHQ